MIKIKKRGFTLIEILLVLSITGVLASVALPRISFYFEPESTVFQRAVEEAEGIALSGVPVRFSIKNGGIVKRGNILAEGLKRRETEEDSLSAFLGTDSVRPVVLEWQELEMKNLPEDDGWKFEPEVIYFYTDGSCSPGKITHLGANLSERDASHYVLTVTGYFFALEDK